jgi:hypothetical protein
VSHRNTECRGGPGVGAEAEAHWSSARPSKLAVDDSGHQDSSELCQCLPWRGRTSGGWPMCRVLCDRDLLHVPVKKRRAGDRGFEERILN